MTTTDPEALKTERDNLIEALAFMEGDLAKSRGQLDRCKAALDKALETLCWIAHHGKGGDSGRAASAYNEAKALINHESEAHTRRSD